MDFALNNLERLTCRKTQTTNQPTSQKYLAPLKNFNFYHKSAIFNETMS